MKNTENPIEEPQTAVVLMEKNTIIKIMLILKELVLENPEVLPLVKDIFNHQPEPHQMFNRHVFTNEQYAALTNPSLN